MRIVAWALAAVVAAAVFFALATAGALWHFSSAPRAFEWKGDAARVVGAPLPFAVAGEAWLDWRGRAVEVDVTVRVAAVDLAGALGTRVVTGEIDRAAGGWLENARYRLTIGGAAASLRAVGGEIFFDAPFSGGADFNLDPQGRAGGIADAAFRSLRILAPGARATAGFAGRARGVVAAAGAGEDWRLAFDSLRLSLDFSRLQAGTVKPPFSINLIPFLGAAADSFAAVYAADFLRRDFGARRLIEKIVRARVARPEAAAWAQRAAIEIESIEAADCVFGEDGVLRFAVKMRARLAAAAAWENWSLPPIARRAGPCRPAVTP